MFSLKKLFGKDETFFDLLEAGAEEARVSVELFGKYLQALAAGGGATVSIDDFIQTRRKEKRIRHMMTEQLSRTFVTPLEREDIEALSFALYRIPKQIEKIVERIAIYPGKLPPGAFARQAELMLQAADALVFMVKQLRGGTSMDKIQEANDRLQYAAGEADKVMITLL
ncbi:MAG: phosphate transport regulator, partial [Verrucomicrobiales bacterium VVV1]